MNVEESEVRPGEHGGILVLLPTFNDWPSLELHLRNLDRVMSEHGEHASLLIVDDGSTIAPPASLRTASYLSIGSVKLLRLRRNLGHQRAIAIGLAYAEANLAAGTVVVMDADGEDDPSDVPRLLERCGLEGDRKIVFAERTKRSESLLFRVFYALYRVFHYLLTGIQVRVGNFSVIPAERLQSLVVVSELWNHYAAAAFKSRQPYCMVPTRRATRLIGRSRMNFVDLVVHGLSAISVYGEIVGVRLLVVASLMILAALAGVVATLVVRLLTDWAIPGWATYTVGIFLVLLVLGIMLAFLFSFVVLSSRQESSFLPCRDHVYFVRDVQLLRD